MSCCCGQAAALPREPELDGIVNALLNEIDGLESRVYHRLADTLGNTPAPAPLLPQESENMPTLQGALHRICSRMEGVNQVLEMIINDLQVQVGELKILP